MCVLGEGGGGGGDLVQDKSSNSLNQSEPERWGVFVKFASERSKAAVFQLGTAHWVCFLCKTLRSADGAIQGLNLEPTGATSTVQGTGFRTSV